MQRFNSTSRQNDDTSEEKKQRDEPILMAAVIVNEEADDIDDSYVPPSQCTDATETVARFAAQNLTGMGLEYMVFQAGILANNTQMYQGIFNFATNYYISPMALLGRSLIWAQRGLLAVAYKEERPENLREIAKSAICDLVALGFISFVYWGGSDLNRHTQLLIEIAFIDSFVVSGTSSLMRAGASKIKDCSQGIHWKFWQKRNGLASIDMDHLIAEESPPTPTEQLNQRQPLPEQEHPSRSLPFN